MFSEIPTPTFHRLPDVLVALLRLKGTALVELYPPVQLPPRLLRSRATVLQLSLLQLSLKLVLPALQPPMLPLHYLLLRRKLDVPATSLLPQRSRLKWSRMVPFRLNRKLLRKFPPRQTCPTTR